MVEFIMAFDDAIYDEKTGMSVFKPRVVGELIRCKDCTKREYCRTSTVWAVPPKDDWYCADAERRTYE